VNRILMAAALVGAWAYQPAMTMTPAEKGAPVVWCATLQGTARLSRNGSCKPSETVLHIGNAGAEGETDVSQRIAALEQRVLVLEQAVTIDSSGVKIHAPFVVVNNKGQIILRVSEKEKSDAGNGARVSIGPGDGGNYALRVYKGGAAFVAGIGESQQGAGAVVTYDSSGSIAASMNGGDHTIGLWYQSAMIAAMKTDSRNAGLIAVYNGETPVAFLTRSSGLDGGNVTTRLNNGDGVFSAGASRNGAGEACVNRKTQAGTPRLACLGLGLPSAGMGK
jgi:hypothetical protein